MDSDKEHRKEARNGALMVAFGGLGMIVGVLCIAASAGLAVGKALTNNNNKE